MVAQSVEVVVDQAANASQDEKLLQDLGSAATAVTQALNDLLKHIKLGAGQTQVSHYFSLAVFRNKVSNKETNEEIHCRNKRTRQDLNSQMKCQYRNH